MPPDPIPPVPPARSDGLRAQSRHRLLAALRARGPSDRAALGAATGLSGAAISRLAGELLAEGLVAGARAPGGGPGRPGTVLSLRAGVGCAVTVSVAIDRLDARGVDFAGATVGAATSRPRTRGLDAGQLVGEVSALVERARVGTLRRVAVGVQGVTEHATSALLWSPVLAVTDVPLAAELESAFGVPASLENDCRAISRALQAGARDALGDSFATVLFSDGVGLGLRIAGHAFAGARSSALEFGHLLHRSDGARCRCGRRGCIEAYAADYAIVRAADGRAASGAPGGRVSLARMRAVADAARAGDPAAVRAFEAAGRALGEGLRQVFTLLDPMPVALVGRDDATLAPMHDALLAGLADVPGSRALGDGDAGAIALHRFDDPDALLRRGLALGALDALDRALAAGDRAGDGPPRPPRPSRPASAPGVDAPARAASRSANRPASPQVARTP